MSESQIAEALHAALDEEASGLRARPDAACRARRQGRRRKVTRSLMASVPAVALVAGGAAVTAHAVGASSPAASHPAVLTAAYVTKQVDSALSSSNINNYIIESTTPGPLASNWTDSATGHLQSVQKSANGTVTIWQANYKAGGQWYLKTTIVDTAAKTATTSTDQGVETGITGLGGLFGESDYGQALATGQATIAGKSVIDGQSVVDLHLSQLNEVHWYDTVTRSAVAGVADFWVNSQNFQLVKVVWGEASHPDTTYFHWFPRTRALVAQVDTPQIPAGYRQINTGIHHMIVSTPAKKPQG
jgi:hypothetical protein